MVEEFVNSGAYVTRTFIYLGEGTSTVGSVASLQAYRLCGELASYQD